MSRLLSVFMFGLVSVAVVLPTFPVRAQPEWTFSTGVSGEVQAKGNVLKETPSKPWTNSSEAPTDQMKADPFNKEGKDPEGSIDIIKVKVSEEGKTLAGTGKMEGDLPLGGKGSVQAGVTTGGYDAQFKVTDEGVKLQGEYTLISAKVDGEAEFKNAFGEQKVSGSVEAAAKVSGEVESSWGDGKYGASGNVGAFAGVKAEVTGTWKFPSILGISLVASGTLEGQAGAGAQASGAFYWKDGKLHLGGQATAALGLGGGASGSVTLDFSELLADPSKQWNKVTDFADSAKNTIKDAAQRASDALRDTAQEKRQQVGDRINQIADWFRSSEDTNALPGPLPGGGGEKPPLPGGGGQPGGGGGKPGGNTPAKTPQLKPLKI